MSDFQALQDTLQRHATQRRAEQELCEGLLGGLYRAFRRAGGEGQPLNNVSMELLPDPERRLQPVPAGEFYAAWFRLGLCEVMIRVRRYGDELHGEFGKGGTFRVTALDDASLNALARQILRDVTRMYTEEVPEGRTAALN